MTLDTSGAVEIGDEAPDFTLPSLGRRDISLSDYRGKRLVLFMWASW
jgi:peroxiredoxin